ncbi:hypothetical protein HETIRDRAFT_454712 [Heterobasidion irregulare TC 32-1]|uniref:Uncharacterized protein n=1 Tax=Heterobasidion irregulare (strain TC 32-1) TaxID=747525 RepID=W4JWE6_HETIT|nr:uncharacterized protein HETIRDRAFT_454712 [Heterobasidion irregulare TC 32-1]ETW77410.1 hypothetical protein HETIRDRAFT_454712 [Heterobasidion irregulare TC 32-1]
MGLARARFSPPAATEDRREKAHRALSYYLHRQDRPSHPSLHLIAADLFRAASHPDPHQPHSPPVQCQRRLCESHAQTIASFSACVATLHTTDHVNYQPLQIPVQIDNRFTGDSTASTDPPPFTCKEQVDLAGVPAGEQDTKLNPGVKKDGHAGGGCARDEDALRELIT